jgi:hypothetical protein
LQLARGFGGCDKCGVKGRLLFLGLGHWICLSVQDTSRWYGLSTDHTRHTIYCAS